MRYMSFHKKTLFSITVFVNMFFFFFASSAFAAEQISSFDVNITVQEDSSITVEESIVYDFGENAVDRHGIFRDIPQNYYLDDNYTSSFFLPVTIHSITDEEGNPYNYELTDGYYLNAKIGDADVNVYGEHTYVIKYTVPNVINAYEDFAEFYWNVTGTDWSVPIQSASVRVSLPAGDDELVVSCYTGLVGFDDHECTVEADTNTVMINTIDGLSYYEGLTVAIGFDKDRVRLPAFLTVLSNTTDVDVMLNSVEVSSSTPFYTRIQPGEYELEVDRLMYIPFAKQLTVEAETSITEEIVLEKEWWAPYFALGFPLILFVLANAVLYLVWLRFGRDESNKRTIVTQFEPVDNLTASEIGTIIDQGVQKRDITAAVLQLAVKGFMHIKKHEKKKFINGRRKHEYTFTLKKDFRDEAIKTALEDFEYKLLYGFFGNKKTEVKLSELINNFYKHLPKVQDGLYSSVVEKGYFKKNPKKTKGWAIALAIIILVGGFFASLVLVAITENIAPLLLTIVFGIEMIAVAFVMPQRTEKGVRALEHILGFKKYLSVAEKDRIAFHDAPDRFKSSDQLFQEYLPYAMVFQVEEEWAKQFEDLHQPDWYDDPTSNIFNAMLFTNAMSSMAGTVGSAMSSAPSSSGSGGGGFSGGGFGGGGGGSW